MLGCEQTLNFQQGTVWKSRNFKLHLPIVRLLPAMSTESLPHMAISDNPSPPTAGASIDHAAVFEQLPHPIVVLALDLTILSVNAAGRRFLGAPDQDLPGTALFDILPQPSPGGTDWQTKLRTSYDEVRQLREPVTLLLSARDPGARDALPAAIAKAPAIQSKAPEGTGMWHVCHGPIFDGKGGLIAIATHALALCGIEAAIAQVSAFATAQLFTVDRSAGSLVDTPIAAVALEVAPLLQPGEISGIDETSADSIAGASDRAMSILIVEDNQDLRSSTAELLQFLGHRVVSVPDAEQALRQLESSCFDILFTDLTLPKMSGAELARHVLQRHHPTRVIITSGYGRAMANAQNLDAIFLPKPYRVADLEEVFAKISMYRE